MLTLKPVNIVVQIAMGRNIRRYFPKDETHRDWGLNIITAGRSEFKPGDVYPDPSHPKDHLFNWNNGRVLNGYYLIFIIKGKGVFEAENMGSTLVEEGNILVLFPGIWHRYKPIKEIGWEEYWVGFNGPYCDFLMNNQIFSSSKPIIPVGLSQQLIQCYQALIDSDFMAQQDYHPFLCGITLQIIGLIQMTNKIQVKNNSTVENGLEKAFFLMHERVDQSINFEDLAKEVGLSYPSFRKTFREKTGIAPNQYFIDLKIKRAQELLKNTNLNINEISYLLDFNSPFYFSRLFKLKTGFSPVDFRLLP